MNFSEEQFNSWAEGPKATETEKCENAENVIQKAIADDPNLKDLEIEVFSQGSFRSRTNVRQESDVDICVCYTNAFYYDYVPGRDGTYFGHNKSELKYADFKNMVGTALLNRFGNDGFTRGTKAFQVYENTYRIVTDVVPTFSYRKYIVDGAGKDLFYTGVAFVSDDGTYVINWPKQNIKRGEDKNDACNRHYKRVVRILKCLAYKMQEDSLAAAAPINSFLIESLVFNVRNELFANQTYSEDLRLVILDLWSRTKPEADTSDLFEVNGMKLIFANYQKWSKAQVHAFLEAVWNYAGYK